MTSHFITGAALAALFASATAPALAQNATPDTPQADAQWGLGLGVGVERKPYREIDNKTRVLPLIMYESRWLSVAGLGLDVKLPPAGPVQFRLRARYAMDGYEASDSPFLRGMAERKGSVWLGGAAIWNTDVAKVSAEWLGDASGHSKGQKLRLGVEHSWRAGQFEITPRVAANWQDRKYVDYYYGVTSGEVLPGRARYDGDATTNAEVGLRVGYALAPRQNLFLDISTTKLGSGIKDSPLVGRSTQSGVRIGYLYRY